VIKRTERKTDRGRVTLQALSDFKNYFWKRRYFFLLVSLLTLGAYLNTLDNAWVSDDIAGILKNRELGKFLISLHSFSLWNILRDLIFLLFGKSVVAYHSANIVFHLLAVILVYFFLLVVTESEQLSQLASLVFALHPIHTEAVSWISGAPYVICSTFFLSAFILFHLYLEARERRRYLAAALAFYLLALFSSLWAVPLLVVFFLYNWYLRGEKPSWSFYLPVLVIIGLRLLFLRENAATRVSSLASGTVFKNPTILVPYSITQYLKLLFWPMALTLYHEGELLTAGYLRVARVVALIFFLILPLIFRRKKTFIFFFLLFILGISFSLSPIQIGWFVAERYLYLSSISFCVLIAYLLVLIERRLGRRGLAGALLVPILSFCFIRIVIRNNDWQSRASLWLATARVSPRSPRVHNNLGDIYGGWGDLDRAIREFELARKLQPRYADATHNLGNIYLQKGDLKMARKYFIEATRYNPRLYQSYYSLGVIAYREGNLAGARSYFEQVLRLNPEYEPAKQALEVLEKDSGH